MAKGEVVNVDEAMHSFMDVQKALEKHYDDKKLQILVCGKTGTGKSSLLNTLFGRELFKIGGPGEVFDFDFDRVTDEVTSECINVQNVFVEIFDSPGLQDGTDNDKKYLDDMQNKCKDVNLVLYYIDMTTTRWLRQDVEATKLLTERFKTDFWKKTVLVLTKANGVKPHSEGENDKEFCKRAYESFKRKFKMQLIDQGVDEKVVSDIPVVAAGSEAERHLPFVSNSASDENQEGCQDFLPELWLTCVEQMSGNSRFNFLKVTDYNKRIKVDMSRLSRAQQELLQDVEKKYKDREIALEENERKLNEMISRMEIENRKEIESMRQMFEEKYRKCVEENQQPKIVYVTGGVRDPSSCTLL